MINKYIVYCLLFTSLTTMWGCKDFLDINEDPNSPSEVTEKLMAPAIISTFAYEVAGGYPVRTSSLWTKHLAYAVAGPHEGNYRMLATESDNFWRYSSYTDVMKTSSELIEKAEKNGNFFYSAIGRIMLAWNMSYVTDAFGDAPFSDAFKGEQGITKPTYDKQEDIYKGIQSLLDQAIADINKNSGLKPGTEDFIYGGKMDNWKKLAYTLKARFYLRLSNAPGYSAVTQANLALQALDAGAISSNAEMPAVSYLGGGNKENPWYQYAIDGKWNIGTKPSIFYINMLTNTNDPRLEYQVDAVVAGANVKPENVGKYIGVVNDATPDHLSNYSSIGSFYSAENASLYLLVYAEVPFIRAEAEYLKANRTVTAAVQAAYNAGIVASMQMYGISDYNVYLTANALNPATAYSQIITQKYIANYLQFEAYNDYRRTGYPALPINDETYPDGEDTYAPFIQSVPVRFTYPSSERSYNEANIPSEIPAGFREAEVIPVWWDK